MGAHLSKNHDDDKTRSYTPLTKYTEVGHYRIIEKIGSGGMGEVYQALDSKLNRKVALKFLPQHLCQDEDYRKRFTREAQAAAKLDHPNIVTIHEVGEFKGRPFFVMEHVEGLSLREIIRQRKLSIAEAVTLTIQLCEGLQEAHESGIVHRDIKPSNIIVDRKGRAKLFDFGLATIKGTDRLTKTGSILGTVAYMSPEQAKGNTVDHRTDIWSLGVVLWEIVTGQLPFRADNEYALMYSILHDEPRLVSDLQANVPPTLEHIVHLALAKILEERYESVQAFMADLKSLENTLQSGSSEGSSSKDQFQQSVAVLPFVDLSANKDQEYFCDGIAEEIINALTHVAGLHVVARTSAFAFKGRQADIREIGRKLNVGTILEGSVRKEGKRVRITAQLVSIANGYQLWSEKYDRDMEGIFTIQDEIGLRVANKLKSELLDEEKKAILRRHTNDPEAYILYLRGIYFLRMYTGPGFKQAIDYFKSALKKDPNYAPAYYGLAETYYVMTYFGNMAPSDAYPSAKAYAMKALEIDHLLGEAHAALGLVHVYYEWDWKAAESELKQAQQLTPNSAMVHMSYSWLLSLTKRHDMAIIEAKKAQQLDPLSNIINAHVGLACIWGGQYDHAVQELQMTLAMNPSFYLAHYYLGLAYRAKSMIEEAVAEFEKAVELGSGIAWPTMILAAAYFEIGKKAQGKKLLENLKQRSEHEYVPSMGFFYIHVACGEMEKAAYWLEQACTQHDSFLPWCQVIPIDCYRIPDEPRFLDLLARAGLQ